MEVTENNFEDAVVQAPGLVLLDVWAPTCGPCKAVEPVVEALAEKFTGRLRLAKLNADDQLDLARRIGVRGLPAVRLMFGGKVLIQWVGRVQREPIELAIQAALEAAA